MVKRVSRSRWGRVFLLTLTLSLAAALVAGLGAGDQAKAQSPQIIMSGTAIGGKAGQGPLSKAVFNHQKHEAKVSNCDACHHTGSQDSCSSCHTSQGSPDGGNIQLSQAMHSAKSKLSCVGCHYKETQKKQCAGCHQFIAAGPKDASCVACHKDPKAAPAPAPKLPNPDTVEIGSISKQYAAVSFNHSAHVDYLKDAAKGELAKGFHAQDTLLCQGCHHNTPAGVTPPKCGTCHGKANTPTDDPKRPGLMAAYHIQCIQCHQAMGVEPVKATDCKGCHAPKK
jgi:hypothetical protein